MKTKSFFSFVIVFLLSFVVVQNASVSASTTNPYTLFVINDNFVELENGSFPVVNETVYIPLKTFSESSDLNLQINNGTVTLFNSQNSMVFNVKSNTITLDNNKEIRFPLFIKDNRIMVPFHYVAEHFGFNISSIQEGIVSRVYNSDATLSDYQFYIKHKIVINKAKQEYSKNNSKKPIYLTFDDGPTKHTNEILDILNKYDAKATFFMLGNNITAYPSSVIRMYNEGNAVGLHGITHEKSLFYKSPLSSLNEMNLANEKLNKVINVKSSIIRTPYGSKPYFTKSFRDMVTSKGFHIWDWNIDSRDWYHKNNLNGTYNEVISELNLVEKQGQTPIVLLHDQVTTIKILPKIMNELTRRGYSFEVITKDMTPHNFWKDTR